MRDHACQYNACQVLFESDCWLLYQKLDGHRKKFWSEIFAIYPLMKFKIIIKGATKNEA